MIFSERLSQKGEFNWVNSERSLADLFDRTVNAVARFG